MALHLNYDGKQNNGIIFNDTYNGCMFNGSEFKPTLTFNYESFMYSEVFTGQPNYVIEQDGTRRLMSADEEQEVVTLATSWVQPLGQEGNPTQEQQLESGRQALKQKREERLTAIVHVFEDGKCMQVRPSDVANIQLAIQQNVDFKWIMEDNTVRVVTVAELQEALADGTAQSKAIWNDYITRIEEL